MPPYVYMAADTDNSLTILDAANPAAPVYVGSIQGAFGAPNWLRAPHAVKIRGIYAFVAARSDDSMTIIDISNPLAPTFVGTLNGPGAPNWLNSPHDICVDGNYVYVVADFDDALVIIDISTPAVPTLASVIRGAGVPPGGNWLNGARGLYVLGDYAYVAAFWDDALTIIDISNPAAPAYSGSIQGAGGPNFLNGANGVYVQGNYAYVVSIDDDALTIIDISNPALPILAGSIRGAGAPPGGNWLDKAYGVLVEGIYAYVAASGDDALTIIDISNPAAPIFVGSIQGAGAPPGGNWLSGAARLSKRGNLVYVAAEWDNSMTIIDVTNPAAPAYVGSIQGWGAPNFLANCYGLGMSPLGGPAGGGNPGVVELLT